MFRLDVDTRTFGADVRQRRTRAPLSKKSPRHSRYLSRSTGNDPYFVPTVQQSTPSSVAARAARACRTPLRRKRRRSFSRNFAAKRAVARVGGPTSACTSVRPREQRHVGARRTSETARRTRRPSVSTSTISRIAAAAIAHGRGCVRRRERTQTRQSPSRPGHLDDTVPASGTNRRRFLAAHICRGFRPRAGRESCSRVSLSMAAGAAAAKVARHVRPRDGRTSRDLQRLRRRRQRQTDARAPISTGSRRNLLQYLSDQKAAAVSCLTPAPCSYERVRDEPATGASASLSARGRIHARGRWPPPRKSRGTRRRRRTLWGDEVVVRFPDVDEPPT